MAGPDSCGGAPSRTRDGRHTRSLSRTTLSSLFGWTPDDNVAIAHEIGSDTDWQTLVTYYTRGRPSPQLLRIFEIAVQHKIRSVLIERRYIDMDWRSEHSRFYSTTFARYPSVCHRLHFFTKSLPRDLGDLSGLQAAYRGYAIMRPIPWAPVGRTMISPPPELNDAISCYSTEEVDILGWPFRVTSVPFVSQDGEYLRCAHAAMWMVLQHEHLRQGLPRRTPFEVHDAALGGVIPGRQVPSDGLSVHQMLAGMTALGLSPGLVSLPRDAADSLAAGFLSLYATTCRYINCNIPPIIISERHAWTCVAYTRAPSAGHTRLTLYRHDDAVGPFIRVDDPFNEPNPAYQRWNSALLPLPPKIYMTGERAEAVGRWWFKKHLATVDAKDPLALAAASDNLTFQTYGQRSSTYKQTLVLRDGLDPGLGREYRLSNWPRNIWVVEALDRQLRDLGDPCVLGEVIIDPTAHHDPRPQDTGILATHASSRYESLGPDHGELRQLTTSGGVYLSGRDVRPTVLQQAAAAP